jgi:hypothetical protein
LSGRNRQVHPLVVALAILVPLLLQMLPTAVAQPAKDTLGNQVDTLLRAFPGGMTPAQADAVLGVMNETELRDALRPRLLGGLEGTKPSPKEAAPVAAYARRIDAVAAAFPRVPAAILDAFARPNGQDAAVGPVKLVLSILFLFAVGTVALLTARRLLPDSGQKADGKALFSAARSLGIRSIWATAFLVGLLLGYALLRPSHPAAPAILVVVLEATLTVSITDLVIRFLCAPNHPDRRLLPVGDQGARSIHRTAVVTATLTAATLGLAQLLGALGMANDPLIALVLPISTTPFLYLLYKLWSSRSAMAHALSGHLGLGSREVPTLVLGLALVTLYLVGLWLTAAAALRLETGTGLRLLVSLFLSAAVPLFALMLRRPITRFYQAPGEQTDSKAALRLCVQYGPPCWCWVWWRRRSSGASTPALMPVSEASSCACCSTWVSSCCSAMSGGNCLPVPSIAS